MASVSGVSNTVVLTGHCTSVTISGIENVVTIDESDAIVASGLDNRVLYRSSSPVIQTSGGSNVLERGWPATCLEADPPNIHVPCGFDGPARRPRGWSSADRTTSYNSGIGRDILATDESVRWWVSTKALRWAGAVLAGLALLAGGLQLWAFAATDGPRHLILGIFALSVGVSVLIAAVKGTPPHSSQ
jgi:hypothetical protein